MADTDANAPETVVQETPKNEAVNPPTPPVEEKKVDNSQLEELRKKAEQAEMRANQLANKLQAKEEAEAQAEAKKLEEQNEYKTLFEQEKAKREAIETERQEEARRKELSEAQATLLAEYDDDVKGLAEDAGATLTDTSDEAVAAYKERLDKFQTRLGKQKVQPNNPGVETPTKEYSREELRVILNDPVKRDAYYREKNGVTAQLMGQE